MANKKIVIIRNAAPQDFGGGERFPVFLSEVLNQEGLEPVILSGSAKLRSFAAERKQNTIKSWWWKKQQWSGINNILIPIYVAWQVILYAYYLALFSKEKPAAVHIQSKDDFIAATHAAYNLGIKVVWTDHADLKHVWLNLTAPFKNPVGKLIYRAARKASSITVVSESEKAFISSHLPKNDPIGKKLQVVYNGVVDSSADYPLSKSEYTEFLIASRLVTDKGIGEAIEAFTRLNSELPQTRLTLIGDGPEAEKFHALAKDTKAITFKGHQSDPISFMAHANVFVHPTYHEGFSVALVEAGMMSLPIIATSVGGNVEIISNEDTGLLIPAKDTNALYAAMKQLAESKDLRSLLGKNARSQYREKYQFNVIVRDSFIPLYGVHHEN